jgi:hypothetical protein
LHYNIRHISECCKKSLPEQSDSLAGGLFFQLERGLWMTLYTVLAIAGAGVLGIGVGLLNTWITAALMGKDITVNRVMGVYAAHLGITVVFLALVLVACRLAGMDSTWPLLAGATGVVLTSVIAAMVKKTK